LGYQHSTRYALVAFVIASSQLPAAVYADEFISEKYGFRFVVPDGFREQTVEHPMTLKAFVEEEVDAADYLIEIHIQPLGQRVNSAQRLDPSQLPKINGLTITPEIRIWRGVELQAVKQETDGTFDTLIVGYLIQFPLHDEAIQLRVQGPKNREQKVLDTFNECVVSFVNTKPFIAKIEATQPGIVTRAVVGFIFRAIGVSLVLAMLLMFVILIRKSQSAVSEE
jgi:hypothetical protein